MGFHISFRCSNSKENNCTEYWYVNSSFFVVVDKLVTIIHSFVFKRPFKIATKGFVCYLKLQPKILDTQYLLKIIAIFRGKDETSMLTEHIREELSTYYSQLKAKTLPENIWELTNIFCWCFLEFSENKLEKSRNVSETPGKYFLSMFLSYLYSFCRDRYLLNCHCYQTRDSLDCSRSHLSFLSKYQKEITYFSLVLLDTEINYCSSQWWVLIIYNGFLEDKQFSSVLAERIFLVPPLSDVYT